MIELIDKYLPYVLAGLVVLNVLLVMLLIIYIGRVSALRKRFERFMSPNSKNHNVEAMLLENIKLIREVKDVNERLQFEQEYINSKLKTCIQYMGMVRYNTFEDVGGDLSYAIALLDEDKNGVVLNSLYYRQGCYTYAKPIIAGESKYQLSPEEQEAIDRAISGIKVEKKEQATGKKAALFHRQKVKKQEQPKGDKMIVKNGSRSNEAAGA